MIKLLLKYCIALIFIQSIGAAELVEVDSKDKNEFQESAFIKLMNKLNAGKIPYPFSNLLDSFGTGLREEGKVLFIPDGRSLVKKSANYHNPRIIVEAVGSGVSVERPVITEKGATYSDPIKGVWQENREKMEKIGIRPGDIYIGFAPEHKALEVISYNPKKPGFDFFVIQDYEEGKTPKIVSNPALCLSCHQNEAPIFSRFPWSESLGDTALAPDVLATNGNQLMELIRKANPARNKIEGIDLYANDSRFNSTQVSFFDAIVRDNNRELVSIKVCEALCPKSNDIECQKELILTAFSEAKDYSKNPLFLNIEEKIGNINIKSSVIPNRNPHTNTGFKEEVEFSLLKKNYPFLNLKELESSLEKSKTSDLTFLESGLFLNDTEINDTVYIDPASPRPINSDVIKLKNKMLDVKTLNEKISLVVNSCLPDLNDIKRKFLKSKTNPEFLSSSEVMSALRYWPNTRQLISVLSNAVENEKLVSLNSEINCTSEPISILPVYKFSDLKSVIEKINDEEIKKPQALFEKYCIQCHGGPSTFIKLPLDSLENMANYIPMFSTTGVEERLKKNIMPPPFATLQPTEKERKEMIKVIEELKK